MSETGQDWDLYSRLTFKASLSPPSVTNKIIHKASEGELNIRPDYEYGLMSNNTLCFTMQFQTNCVSIISSS